MAGDQRSQVIRTSWNARVVGTITGGIVLLLSWTIRFKVEARCGFARRGAISKPLIWCIWHNRMLALAMARVRGLSMAQRRGPDQCEPRRSRPRGGGQSDWGGGVRGSSSRRGLGALKDMKRSIRDGFDVGVTPDGPRGPR